MDVLTQYLILIVLNTDSRLKCISFSDKYWIGLGFFFLFWFCGGFCFVLLLFVYLYFFGLLFLKKKVARKMKM